MSRDSWLVAGPTSTQLWPSSEIATVQISGSETFVYLRHGELSFIVQEDGVFHHDLGEVLAFYIDPGRLLAFDASAGGAGGALVASYR